MTLRTRSAALARSRAILRGSAIAAGVAAAVPAAGQTVSEQALANSRVLPMIDPCAAPGAGGGDEIVVCGRRGGQDRYRLPPTGEGEPFGRRVPGEAPRASAEPLSFAPCGIFAGQRRCSKREMREYGYGGGRDPLTVAGKLLTALTDPDAAAGPPPLPPGPRSP